MTETKKIEVVLPVTQLIPVITLLMIMKLYMMVTAVVILALKDIDIAMTVSYLEYVDATFPILTLLMIVMVLELLFSIVYSIFKWRYDRKKKRDEG